VVMELFLRDIMEPLRVGTDNLNMHHHRQG
jgi:hypothetical protein